MRVLFRFLLGDQHAILQIAGNRAWLSVGAVFVLLAGIAQHGHTSDLSTNWPALGLGFAFSSISALFVLWFTVHIIRYRREQTVRNERGSFLPTTDENPPPPDFRQLYESFLTLVWLTSPAAFLAAIPFQQLFSPGTAQVASFVTGTLVTLYQLAIVVRTLSVLTSVRWYLILVPVLASASIMASVAFAFLSVQEMLSSPSGLRAAASNTALAAARGGVTLTVLLAVVPLVITALVTRRFTKPGPQPILALIPLPRSIWLVCAVAALGLAAAIHVSQRQQRNHTAIKRTLRDMGTPAPELAERLNQISWDDLPPDWTPTQDARFFPSGQREVLSELERLALTGKLTPPVERFVVGVSWVYFQPGQYGLERIAADVPGGWNIIEPRQAVMQTISETDLTTLKLHAQKNEVLPTSIRMTLQRALDRAKAQR